MWLCVLTGYLTDRVKKLGLVADSNNGTSAFLCERKRLAALYRKIFPGDEFEEAIGAIHGASISDASEPPLPFSEFEEWFGEVVVLCDNIYEVYQSASRGAARGCLDATAALLRRRADRFGTPYSYERDLFGRIFTGLKAVHYLDVEALLTSWAEEGPRGGRPPQGGGPPVALAVGAVAAVALTAGLVLHRRRRP